MNITGLNYRPAKPPVTNPISFGKQPDISVVHNRQSFEQVAEIQKQLDRIIKEIGGVGNTTSFDEKVLKAKIKIGQLRQETVEAWRSCPSALKPKLEKLDTFKRELETLSEAFKELNEKIDNEPEGLIIPGQENGKPKGGLITDPEEVMSGYNRLPKDTNSVLQTLNGKIKTKAASSSSLAKLKQVTTELNKDNFDFEKLNALDAEAYQGLKDSLLIGSQKKEVEAQLQLIDKKLTELKEKKGKFIPQVGVKVYSPETTGKILALETAKLRRTTLNAKILLPGVDENLDKPDVVLNPIEGQAPAAYKIDRSFVPTTPEINEMLSLNKNYQPILERMYPKGVNVFIVPGYSNHDGGELEGGFVALDRKEGANVWLNSYDVDSRIAYTKMKEGATATLRGLNKIQNSVLSGNKDRARVLAHELGHAVCYKQMEIDEKQNENSNKASSIIVDLSSGGIDFVSGWKGLRTGAKLNDLRFHPSQVRSLPLDDLKAVRDHNDFEMIAEDIRMAITGDKLPASSKMTGYFDQTEEGKKQLESVMNYLRQFLIEQKSATEAMFGNIKGTISPQ